MEQSKAELSVISGTLEVLQYVSVGEQIPPLEDLRGLLLALEFFVPKVLRREHEAWRRESLDEVFPLSARVCNSNEIEIVGTCILISDQTLTPIRIHYAIDKDSITRFEVWLGEETDSGMRRESYRDSSVRAELGDPSRLASICWSYHVKYDASENTN